MNTQVEPMQTTTEGTKVKKMLFILSKATIENVYAAFVMANGARMEGIDAEIFFTFFGLEAIQKKKLEHLHVATVGNPAMHIPTMIGGLPGMEALATKMMKKEMEKLLTLILKTLLKNKNSFILLQINVRSVMVFMMNLSVLLYVLLIAVFQMMIMLRPKMNF